MYNIHTASPSLSNLNSHTIESWLVLKVSPLNLGTYQEMKSTQEENLMDTSGALHARKRLDIFKVAEDDMDITVAAVPENVEKSGAQLDDYKGVVYFYIHTEHYNKISMYRIVGKFGEH